MSTDRQKRALHLRRIREDPAGPIAKALATLLGVALAVALVAAVVGLSFLAFGEW